MGWQADISDAIRANFAVGEQFSFRQFRRVSGPGLADKHPENQSLEATCHAYPQKLRDSPLIDSVDNRGTGGSVRSLEDLV